MAISRHSVILVASHGCLQIISQWFRIQDIAVTQKDESDMQASKYDLITELVMFHPIN